jgi:TetR/AcrR family transcriptional regulator, regulator of biofilm formation and stress response
MSLKSKPRRSVDRNRSARIIDAAVEVIRREGVGVLSHRRVAQEAGVPLAATTYYFSSLEDLLCAALQFLVQKEMARVRQAFAGLAPGASVAQILSKLICEAVDQGRDASVLAFELYAAALRSERIRAIAAGWNEMWQEILEPRVGRDRAIAAIGTATWIIQQTLLKGTRRISRRRVLEIIAQVLPES